MNKVTITQLKSKLELHYQYLVKKHPLTQTVLEAIDSLIEMNAQEQLIKAWYNSIYTFVQIIEQEIKLIENNNKKKYL